MPTISATRFSDIYITPQKEAFIPDMRSVNALMRFEPEDLETFYQVLQNSWDGKNPSYSVLLPRGTNGGSGRHSILRAQNAGKSAAFYDPRLSAPV